MSKVQKGNSYHWNSHIKITIRDLLRPIVKNHECHSMLSNSEDNEHGVFKPFGKVTVQEMPIEIKAEVDSWRIVTWL